MDVADDDLMMDVADNDFMPPLLPDSTTSINNRSTTSINNSRKNNEACQANLKRTGREKGQLNNEQTVENPNYSRENCPGSMDNLQRKGRVRGSKNKEKPPKPPKPPGFNPNQKRDEANLKKKEEKKEAKKRRERSFRRRVREEVTEQVPKVHSPVHQRKLFQTHYLHYLRQPVSQVQIVSLEELHRVVIYVCI